MAAKLHKRWPPVEPAQQCLKSSLWCNRFVGLLLATKLLPAGNEHVMRTVYNAVGPTFISRLLLPLKFGQVTTTAECSSRTHTHTGSVLSYKNVCTQASSDGHVDQNQVAAAAGLGLAVLAALCRVPELGSSIEILELIPLFLKVFLQRNCDSVHA